MSSSHSFLFLVSLCAGVRRCYFTLSNDKMGVLEYNPGDADL